MTQSQFQIVKGQKAVSYAQANPGLLVVAVWRAKAQQGWAINPALPHAIKHAAQPASVWAAAGQYARQHGASLPQSPPGGSWAVVRAL